jgi:hypothetical protein
MSRNNSKARREGFRGGRRHDALGRACRSAAPFDARQWETFESRILFAIPVVKFTFNEPVTPDQIVTNSGTSGAAQNGTLAGAEVLTAARDDSEPDPAMRPLSPAGGGYLAMTGGTTHMEVGSAGDHTTWLDPILGAGSSSLAYWIRVRGQVGVGNAWQSPGVSGVEHNDGNDIFWGNLDPNARLRLQPGDGTASVSTTAT